MKAPWDTELARKLLANNIFATCWRFFSPIYNSFLKHTFYQHGVLRDIGGGKRIRVSFENRRLRSSTRLLIESQWLTKSMKPGMTVFDIGANIGLFSILLGETVGSTGKIIAFEPSPLPFSDLQQNIQLNKLTSVVKSYQTALGNQVGTLNFFLTDDPHDTQHSAIPPTKYAVVSRKIEVPVLTLDEFCKREPLIPDVLKIDVEGFEPFVLEGARETIQRAKTLTVFLELHPWAWEAIGYTETKFYELLCELGLQPAGTDYKLDENHIRLTKASPENRS